MNSYNVGILPAGVKPLDGGFVVPKMGENWADPKNLPLRPIFGIHNEKLVFLESMPDKDLDKTVHDIPGMGGIPIPPSGELLDDEQAVTMCCCLFCCLFPVSRAVRKQ